MTLAPCPTHGSTYRALHEHNFRGIVEVIDELFFTISGVVGTTSYSRCAVGYPWNFEGIVRALEDLNTTISGIQGGGGGSASGIAAGSGIYITESGTFQVINSAVSSASGIIYTAGSGLYLSDGGTQFNADYAAILQNAAGSGLYLSDNGITLNTDTAEILQNSAGSGIYFSSSGVVINVDYEAVYQNSVSGHLIGDGSVTVLYSGSVAIISGTASAGGGGGGASVTVSGAPGTNYTAGALWFDTNEGRLFIYASGNGISEPAWYQTNAEALAAKGEAPPSGAGLNAPPRDGSIWFNTLLGSLFVYDATTSGWYETGPSRSFAYGSAAPAPSAQGAGWYDSANSHLRVWDGSSWVQV